MTIKPERPINKCEHCGWPYPSQYLNQMRTSDHEFHGKYICGICALNISNMIHRVTRDKFDGAAAERFRLAAIEWREKHPYDDPERRKNDTTRS
jgi:hypothetical protein